MQCLRQCVSFKLKGLDEQDAEKIKVEVIFKAKGVLMLLVQLGGCSFAGEYGTRTRRHPFAEEILLGVDPLFGVPSQFVGVGIKHLWTGFKGKPTGSCWVTAPLFGHRHMPGTMRTCSMTNLGPTPPGCCIAGFLEGARRLLGLFVRDAAFHLETNPCAINYLARLFP